MAAEAVRSLHASSAEVHLCPTVAVTLRVVAPTRFGEAVFVSGAADALGNWDLQRTVRLETNEVQYPVWSTVVQLPRGVVCEYKYLIQDYDGERVIRWESAKGGNRKIVPDGLEMVLDDGELGRVSAADARSAWVDHGWVRKGAELLLFVPSFRANRGVELLSGKPATVDIACGSQCIVTRNVNPTWTSFAVHVRAREQIAFTLFVYEDGDMSPAASLHCVAEEFDEVDGTCVRALANARGEIIGKIFFDFLLVQPFKHNDNNLRVTGLASQLPKHIGHRGYGNSKATHSEPSAITENTILSFMTAASKGARFVEFDVQLSKDMVPVIMHDFFVPMNDVDVPVICFTAEQLDTPGHAYKAPARTSASSSSSSSSAAASMAAAATAEAASGSAANGRHSAPVRRTQTPDRLEASGGGVSGATLRIHERAPTLKQLFRKLPPNIGFNIEVKYPQYNLPRQHYVPYASRNELVDRVLEVVFAHCGERQAFFSSFDPDVVALLRLKQPRFPVFLLTDGLPAKHVIDCRRNSLREAVRFAEQYNLAGVVAHVPSVLKAPECVAIAHAANIIVFTYGDENNSPAEVDKQLALGVDGVICDKVARITDHFRSIGVVTAGSPSKPGCA